MRWVSLILVHRADLTTQFDLRAVLVHDGYYGRNHLYSYVKDKTKWWKVLEQTTSEVLCMGLSYIAASLHWHR